MAAKTLENLYHLQMLKLSKNGKKSEIPKEKKTESYVFSGFGNGIYHS